MGNARSSRLTRILMCGCDGAGKTTILNTLNLGEVMESTPTVAFTIEILKFKNIELCSWDVGDTYTKLYPLWRNYFRGSSALIWVVDSNDREVIGDKDDHKMNGNPTSHSELHDYFLNDESLRHVPVLILATKQDLSNIMSIEEVQNRLGMTQTIKYSIDSFRSIQKGTLLLLLDDKTIDLLCEYALGESKCGPNLEGVCIKPKVLSQKGMLTFEFLKGPRGLGWEDMKKIQAIICEYVPPYEQGINGTQTECKTFGCNAITGDGLHEGLQWLFTALNIKNEIVDNDKKKECVLL
eukprot:525681_1